MSQFRATPSCPWPLLSKKDVEEASPSRKEGMTYAKEMSFVRSMCELMKKIGASMKLTRAVATAIVFAHRYYAMKSMQKNDRFIISAACLFLAGKVEDEPRALSDVAQNSFKMRYFNSPAVLKTMKDPEIASAMKEAILTAERALLYALGFQFTIDHPQVFIRDTLDRFSALPDPEGEYWRHFKKEKMPLLQNFINDLYKGTKLVLRYDLRLLGATAIHLGLATVHAKLPTWNHEEVPKIDGKPWYEVAMMKSQPFGDVEGSPITVTKQLLEEIGKEIMALYVTRSQEGAEAKDANEANEADGPVTPPLDHFQATTPTGSRAAEDRFAGEVPGHPGLSPDKDGQRLPGSAASAAEAGSSAQQDAGPVSSLRPGAAEFYPSAEKAAASSDARMAAHVSPQTGAVAMSPAAQHGQTRKRTSDVAGLDSQPQQGRSPKSLRGVPTAANGGAGTAGRSPAEMHHVPNGGPAAVPNGQAAGSHELGSPGLAASLAKHAVILSPAQQADPAGQMAAHKPDANMVEVGTTMLANGSG